MDSRKIDTEHMSAAQEAAESSNCMRKKVGAVIAKGEIILVSSANGTPSGMISCKEGGCPRCSSNPSSGENYDSCLCVHAEQSVIAKAAKAGLPIMGATLYCTLRPCLTCLNLSIHSGIVKLIYYNDIQFRPSIETAYKQIINETGFDLSRFITSEVN